MWLDWKLYGYVIRLETLVTSSFAFLSCCSVLFFVCACVCTQFTQNTLVFTKKSFCMILTKTQHTLVFTKKRFLYDPNEELEVVKSGKTSPFYCKACNVPINYDVNLIPQRARKAPQIYTEGFVCPKVRAKAFLMCFSYNRVFFYKKHFKSTQKVSCVRRWVNVCLNRFSW